MELSTQAHDPALEEKDQKVREKEDIFVNGVIRRFEKYKDILDQPMWRPQWLRNYKLWRSYIDKKKYPHRSKIFVPLTFQYLETILPRVASNKVKITVSPRRPDAGMFVDSLNQLMSWIIDRNRLNTKWPTFARQLVMHGYSVAYPFWNMDMLTGFPYPDFKVIDLFNFFVDPISHPDLEECPEAIIRSVTTIGALRGKERLGLYEKGLIDKLEETSRPKDIADHPVTERHQAIGKGYDDEDGVGEEWKKVELLLHITPWKTSVIANRKIVLREIENDGILPLVGCSWTEDLFCLFGLGQIEPAQGLQHGVNAANNMVFDSRTLMLRPATLVGTANATVEDSKFQARAGSIIRVTDVNQVRPYVDAGDAGGMDNERMFNMMQMQETHSAMDIVRGASGAEETATQAQINNAAIETKLSFPTQKMEGAIKRLGMIWHGMVQKNMDPATLEAMGFADGMFPMGLDPRALSASVDFVPVIEPEAPLTKQFKRREMQEAIGGILGMPGFPELMMMNPILKARIYEIALRHFEIDEGTELIATIHQAIEEEMQAALAAQQQPPPGAEGMPPQGAPPPAPPMDPEMMGMNPLDAEIGALMNAMSDEELAMLLEAPPEQMQQILTSMTQAQHAGRPEQMPQMQPAVTTQGVF